VAKASKKYSLGDNWISTPSTPTSPVHQSQASAVSTGLGDDLIRRSLQQNDLLFSNEGLTLLSLDRVYSFKLALSTYSRLVATQSQPLTPTTPTWPFPSPETLSENRRIEAQQAAKIHAVDELRLLTLSQHGRAISKSYLLRAYDHLSISMTALRAVNEAYKSCFHCDGVEIEAVRLPIGLPLRQGLSLRTGYSKDINGGNFVMDGSDGIQRLDRGPHFRAPATPGGYDDVTPITRGEWGFLRGGLEPRTGAVETF
jgi:hypothetical protein